MKEGHKTEPNDTVNVAIGDGLTKREYFAAMAMQGMLANISGVMTEGSTRSFHPDDISEYAINQADTLIAELNKTP